MKFFKKRNCVLEIIDNEIFTYDLTIDAVDYLSEGKLCAVTQEDEKEIEELLNIDSIKNYGVDIINESIECCDKNCDIVII